MIKNKVSGMCVNVEGSPGLSNNANIEANTCEYELSNSDQIWSMDIYGRLSSRPSKKCIDVRGYRSTSPGQNLAIYWCEDPYGHNSDHVWFFEYQPGTRFFRIQNYHTGLCLDVAGMADPSEAVNIEQNVCEGYYSNGTDQWWEKVKVDY